MRPASLSVRLTSLGALVALLLPGAGPAPALEPPGVLRVVAPLDRDFAFVAKDPAPPDAPGFDVEILQGFARLRGLRLELSFSPSWDGAIPLLLEHKADLIAGGYSDIPERRRKVAEAPPGCAPSHSH